MYIRSHHKPFKKPENFPVEDYEQIFNDIHASFDDADAAAADEWIEWDKLMDVCSEANDVDLQKAFQIMGIKPQKLQENEKCFIKCMGEGLHFLNADGTLNETGAQTPHFYLNEKRVPKALERCKRIQGTNVCDKAVRQSQCFFQIAGIQSS